MPKPVQDSSRHPVRSGFGRAGVPALPSHDIRVWERRDKGADRDNEAYEGTGRHIRWGQPALTNGAFLVRVAVAHLAARLNGRTW